MLPRHIATFVLVSARFSVVTGSLKMRRATVLMPEMASDDVKVKEMFGELWALWLV